MKIVKIEPVLVSQKDCSLRIFLSQPISDTWWNEFVELWSFKGSQVYATREFRASQSFNVMNIPRNCINDVFVREIYTILRRTNAGEQE